MGVSVAVASALTSLTRWWPPRPTDQPRDGGSVVVAVGGEVEVEEAVDTTSSTTTASLSPSV